MLMKAQPRPKSGGFSLVEMMVAIVAGMIVVGAVLAFTISSLRSNTEYVQSTRLTQELRNSMSLVSNDLRRAGYDDFAIRHVSNPSAPSSPFAQFQLTGGGTDSSCIVYSYDRPNVATGAAAGVLNLANNEVRGLRRSIATLPNGQTAGVIEIAERSTAIPTCASAGADYSTYPASCNTTTGWCPLSDPRTLDVLRFRLDLSTADPAVPTGSAPIRLREIAIALQGRLPSNPDVVRGVQSAIKVRADCVRTTLADCANAPTL